MINNQEKLTKVKMKEYETGKQYEFEFVTAWPVYSNGWIRELVEAYQLIYNTQEEYKDIAKRFRTVHTVFQHGKRTIETTIYNW